MKKSEATALLWTAAAGLGVFFLAKLRTLRNLVFTPGQINDMGFMDGAPWASFTILIQNTSNTGLTINSFAGNVFSNNSLIGNVYNFQPVRVEPNSYTPVNVFVQLRTISLVNDIIRAFQYNNFSQKIDVNGFANISGAQLPVDLSFTFGNPNNPPI